MRTSGRASLLVMTSLLLSSVAVVQSSALAQSSSSDWQSFRPEGEEFTIVMPKDPKFLESQEPYHRDMTLNTRLYLSASDRGPVLAVASLSGIKANGVGYNDFLRLNSYVDAFKNWFPQKVRGKDAVAKLTLVGEKTLNGNVGREYRLVIGDLSGTARVFATRRRFYAAVALNTKKDDELTDQFLSSFMLPEKIVQPQPTVVATAPNPPSRNPKENPNDPQKTDPASVTAADSKTDDGGPTTGTKPRAPISGGILNGKAIYLAKPEYPPEARAAGAGGTVMIQVLIDEGGAVISATAVSGHPLLQQTSVNAALASKFSPTRLSGEPVKVMGVIQYNFASP